jgi:hypothetical protein
MAGNEKEPGLGKTPKRKISRVAIAGFIISLLLFCRPFLLLAGILGGLISLAGAVNCIVRRRQVRGLGLALAGMVLSFEFFVFLFSEHIAYYAGTWAVFGALLLPIIVACVFLDIYVVLRRREART